MYTSLYSLLTKEEIRDKVESRECQDCKEIKPGKDFPVDRAAKSGLHTYCFECLRIRANNYDEENRDFRRQSKHERYHFINKVNPEYRYNEYKRGALSRGLEFTITMEEFMYYWGKSCTYCGDPIETIGLDRIDNKKGYTITNINSCCFYCNQLKSTKELNGWINKIKQIAEYYKEV